MASKSISMNVLRDWRDNLEAGNIGEVVNMLNQYLSNDVQEITAKEFKERLSHLANSNKKVGLLLSGFNGFNKMPPFQRDLILSELGVTMKKTTTTTYMLNRGSRRG